MTLWHTVIFTRCSHFAAHKHVNNTIVSAVGGDWKIFSRGPLRTMWGLSALEQVKVFFFLGHNIWATNAATIQLCSSFCHEFSRNDELCCHFWCFKMPQRNYSAWNISRFQHAGLSWCLFYTFFFFLKRPCHRSEIEMMWRFKSGRSDCASGVKWNMEQLIQGVEVLMCSSGQNFIALHNSRANNKGGGWMFLLVAAVCLYVGTCRNTEQLKQATTRGCLLLFFGCPPPSFCNVH